MLLSSFSGCSRRFWRLQGDRDTYNAIAQKQSDARWILPRMNIDPDARSRFYDPHDPDCSPLPPDDPAANRYMRVVDGKRGYKSWHKLGRAFSIENPQWLEPFGVGVGEKGDPVFAHDQVHVNALKLPDALELSYIHSREYQTQIENLYLAALALTGQRFQFDVRYLRGAGLPGTNLELLTTPNQNQTPGVGDTSVSNSPGTGVRQFLPSGAQWAVELANNTLWILGGGGASATASTLSYSLVQPLLLGAGRKINLEVLTQAEREVLYTTRDLARFRKTFFAATTAQYLNILNQRQIVLNQIGNIQRLEEQIRIQTATDSRPDPNIAEPLAQLPADLGDADGNLRDLPEALQGKLSYSAGYLRWERSMSATDEELLLSLSDAPAFQQAAQELITRRATVYRGLNLSQLQTQLSSAESSLQSAERSVQDSLDDFKIQLGLPPNVELSIDDSLLGQFELISPKLFSADESLKEFVTTYQDIDITDPDFARLREIAAGLKELRAEIESQAIQSVVDGFAPVDELLQATKDDFTASPEGLRHFASEEERVRVAGDVANDKRLFASAKGELNEIDSEIAELTRFLSTEDGPTLLNSFDADNDGETTPDELPKAWEDTFRKRLDSDKDGKIADAELRSGLFQMFQDLRERLLQIVQGLQVIQIAQNIETIAINPLQLPGQTDEPTLDEVLKLGLENRVDLMNARAQVTDARRAVEIAANALEAALDLTVAGDVDSRPISGLNTNPFSFSKNRSSFRVGLEFDAPVDQIDERNTYNSALIAYQRERRAYMAFEDQVKQQIRNDWRALQVNRTRLGINRVQIRASARQYDTAVLDVSDPTPSAGSRNALNLLNALDSILNAQNSVVSNWFNYEISRINLFRDIGIMEVDPRGAWTDPFYAGMERSLTRAVGPMEDPSACFVAEPHYCEETQLITPLVPMDGTQAVPEDPTWPVPAPADPTPASEPVIPQIPGDPGNEPPLPEASLPCPPPPQRSYELATPGSSDHLNSGRAADPVTSTDDLRRGFRRVSGLQTFPD